MTLVQVKDIAWVKKGFRSGDKVICYANGEKMAANSGGVVAVVDDSSSDHMRVVPIVGAEGPKFVHITLIDFTTANEKKQRSKHKRNNGETCLAPSTMRKSAR